MTIKGMVTLFDKLKNSKPLNPPLAGFTMPYSERNDNEKYNNTQW